MQLINNQLTAHSVLVQHGAVVDASITPTPRRPKGKKSYDLHENGTITVSQSYQKGVDPEASWTKKGHKLYYGYKRHVLVESKEGLFVAISTTKASNHDGAHLPILLDKVSLKAGSRLYGYKGYSGLPKVERLFGSIKRWFRSAGTRYIGMEKTHTQHVMEAIAYNLYRAPNIILKGV